MGGGLARLSGSPPYVQHVIPKAVAMLYPEGSNCISPTAASSGGMTLGRTGSRHLLRDRVAGAELHHVPCPMVTASTVVHGVA